MTNSYNMAGYPQGMDMQMYQQGNQTVNPQMVYPQGISYQYPYQNSGRGAQILGGALTNAAIGFAGGTAITAGIDYFRNRQPVNNGAVKDSFAQQVLDKMIKKDYTAKGKQFFKEIADISKHIGSIKSPEKFRKLMEKNKKYCSTLCDGISLKTMCDTVTKENLKDKIAAIKERIEASLRAEKQNIKDIVALCWDNENKKFVKPKSVDEKLYKIIKNTKNDVNWKKAFKYGGITAGILGGLTIGAALLMNRNQNS